VFVNQLFKIPLYYFYFSSFKNYKKKSQKKIHFFFTIRGFFSARSDFLPAIFVSFGSGFGKGGKNGGG